MENLKALISELKLYGITDSKVLRAIEKVDRKLFVPSKLLKKAYENNPHPIGYGATISQPYTVAYMLQELELKPGMKVLEIGTGSGYNASLIGYLIKPGLVYSIEIVPELVRLAENNIKKTKLSNIKIFNLDGRRGLEKYAKFDRIVLTASAKKIPCVLFKQLKNNGILLAPIGSRLRQELVKIRKDKNKFKKEYLGGFVFVPLK